MHLDVQQNLDVVHLDVVHLDAMPLLVVVVDAVLPHQVKIDCCQDVVGEEVRHLLKMDCCQDVVSLDEVQLVHLELEELLVQSVWNLHEQSLLE